MEEEQKPIDKLGKCPHCNKDWDGGDIYDVLASMGVNVIKSQKDVEELAKGYGWTPENKLHFSNTNTIEIDHPLMKEVFYQCNKCNYVYEALTGKEYRNIQEAKNVDVDEPDLA